MKTECTSAIQIISDIFWDQIANEDNIIGDAEKYLLLYFAYKVGYTGDSFSGDSLHRQFYNFLKNLKNKGLLIWVIEKDNSGIWETYQGYSSLDYKQEEVLSDMADLRYNGGGYRLIKKWVPLSDAISL